MFRRRTGDHPSDRSARDRPLREAVLRSSWQPRDAEWEMLADLEYELGGRPRPGIAILEGSAPSPLGGALQAAYPRAGCFSFDIRAEPWKLHARLAARAPYDVIIDDTRRVRLRRRVFRSSFLHLRPGGIYLVRDFRARRDLDPTPHDRVLWPYLQELIALRSGPRPEKPHWRTRDELHRADALGRMVLGTEHLIVTNRTTAYVKLREREMNRVIKIRKDRRARILRSIPPTTLESRATLMPDSLYERERRYRRSYRVPRMSIRRYRGATVIPAQVVLQGNLVLPESFRHHLYPRLKNRRLTDLTHYFATVGDLGPVQRLPGRYFHLDAEYRAHFGHLLTEQVSRLWAWPELKERVPDLKAVLSLAHGRMHPAPYEIDVFRAAGIDEDDLVPIDGPVEVDELYGVTPMMSMPDYVHPEISRLWRRVGDRLAADAPDQDGPERIFITRPDRLRPCHNREQVEQRFREAGFEIIRPERLPLSEQVQIFRRAEVVAGFGGSGLFNLMFRDRPATVIIVQPDSYTSVNEYMIGSIHGNVQYQVNSRPDVDHPPGGWTWDAFRSGFTFDFGREGRDLDRILAGL